MAKKIGQFAVHVTDEKGKVTCLNPGDEVPAWAEKLITNPLAFAGEDGEPAEEEPGAGETFSAAPPPQAGKGSGREAWENYAFQLGVNVTEDDSRDDIIEKVEKAGYTV